MRVEVVEFVMAPYEANAQLPWLPRLDPVMGGVSAVISKDNDLIAYGCPVVGTNGSSSQILLWWLMWLKI
jgi:hypothetical protein